MPITVTIKERLVAKSEDNEGILQYWHESHKGIPVEIVNPLSEPFIENIKGNIAALKRYMETWNFHINDAGQNIKLEPLTVDLDSRAYELYMGFNFFLNDVAIKMGLSSVIDKEVATGSEATQESFAIIKNLLLKMVLKILSNKAGQDKMNIHYQTILGNFIDKLSQSKHSTEKGLFNFGKGVEATEFSKYFMKEMMLWKEKISWMVEEVATINLTKSTVEANLQNLESIQRHVLRHLYIRLSCQFLGEKVELTDFKHDWIPNFLHRVEATILNANPDSPSLELVNTTGNGSRITRERGNAVCAQLKLLKKTDEQPMKDNLGIIQELYRSLYDITVIKDAVHSIDTLVSMTGCLPFLMRYIKVEELSRYIDIYSKACMEACTDKGIEHTIIAVVCNAYTPSKEKNILPFKKLGDSDILSSMSSAIFAVLGELTRTCTTHGCASIIDDNHKFILSSFPIEKKESSLLMLQDDVPKDALLNCLGLSRAALIDLSEFLKQENNAWKRVRLEASAMLKDKSLPHQLQSFIRSKNGYFDVDVYQAPFQTLPFLADELRNVLKQNDIPSNILAISNNDLLDFVEKQNTPYLESYKKSIQEYRKSIEVSDDFLQESLMKKEFVLAWFKYWYLDTQGDLIYIPNVPTTLNILAECYNLNVIISTQDPLTKKIVDDNSNVFENSQQTIHINYTNNFPVPTPTTPQAALATPDEAPIVEDLPEDIPPVAKQNKTDLNDFLFEVLDSSIDAESKIHIFNHFLTNNSILESRGITGARDALEKANKIVSFFESSNQTLDAWFIKKSSDYVFSGILKLVEENPSLEHEELGLLIESSLQQLIRKYIVVQSTADYGNKPSVISPRIILNNATSLLLLGNDSKNNKKFLVFSEDPLFHYLGTENGDYTCFVESTCADNADSALLALDIDIRDNFMAIINESLKKPKNRAMLAIDIFQELTSHYDKHPQETIWENIALDEWVKFLQEYTRIERAIELLKNNVEKRKEYMERVKELALCRSKMLDYCASTDLGICEKYLNKCIRDNADIGKYMLRIYASEKQFSLYIYNKKNKSGLHFQEITQDESASLIYPHAQKSLHIVSTNNHYDKLNPQPSACSAREVAKSYFADLQKKLTVLTETCLLKEEQSLEDYRDTLLKFCSAPDNGKKLTIREEQMLVRSKKFLVEAKPCLSLLKEREENFVILKDKGLLAKYIPRISQLQDQMVFVDEPRDNKNRTLLYKAIENNVASLIDYFLAKDASVVSCNEGHFTVKSALPAEDCTYILEKRGNQRRSCWFLNFYEHAEATLVAVDIKEIVGLELLLSNSANSAQLEICQKARKLIQPYHEKRYVKTPLLLVEKTVGFSRDNLLYFNLLSSAQKEMCAPPHLNLKQFPALEYCLDNIISPIKITLEYYIAYQMRKLNSSFTLPLNMNLYPTLTKKDFPAGEVAMIYRAAIGALNNYNFAVFLDTLSEMAEISNYKQGGVFHYGNLYKILCKAVSWMHKNSAQYHKEYREFQILLQSNEIDISQTEKQENETDFHRKIKENADKKIKEAEKRAEDKIKEIDENAAKRIKEAEQKLNGLEKTVKEGEQKEQEMLEQFAEMLGQFAAMQEELANLKNQSQPNLGQEPKTQPGNKPKSESSEEPSGLQPLKPKGLKSDRFFSPQLPPELSGVDVLKGVTGNTK